MRGRSEQQRFEPLERQLLRGLRKPKLQFFGFEHTEDLDELGRGDIDDSLAVEALYEHLGSSITEVEKVVGVSKRDILRPDVGKAPQASGNEAPQVSTVVIGLREQRRYCGRPILGEQRVLMSWWSKFGLENLNPNRQLRERVGSLYDPRDW